MKGIKKEQPDRTINRSIQLLFFAGVLSLFLFAQDIWLYSIYKFFLAQPPLVRCTVANAHIVQRVHRQIIGFLMGKAVEILETYLQDIFRIGQDEKCLLYCDRKNLDDGIVMIIAHIDLLGHGSQVRDIIFRSEGTRLNSSHQTTSRMPSSA